MHLPGSAWEADQGRKNSYYASIANRAMASEVANRSAADAVHVGRSKRGLEFILGGALPPPLLEIGFLYCLIWVPPSPPKFAAPS